MTEETIKIEKELSQLTGLPRSLIFCSDYLGEIIIQNAFDYLSDLYLASYLPFKFHHYKGTVKDYNNYEL